MQTVSGLSEAREILGKPRREGAKTAFVPTMGNLHAGHLALVNKAREVADFVVVSIFVNPLQFGEGEDFADYPKTPAEDSRKLVEAGTDLLFAPSSEQVYPKGLERTTRVEVPKLGDILCGAYRPGHFSGVATVVNILFNIVRPDVAVFGLKDFQQVLVIRRMVDDLLMNVDLIAVETVREADGLAMSSRNAYLSREERAKAPLLYQTLNTARSRIVDGIRDFSTLEDEGTKALSSGGFHPDYFSIRCARDLALPEEGTDELVILAAARLGPARLIDNMAVTAPIQN